MADDMTLMDALAPASAPAPAPTPEPTPAPAPAPTPAPVNPYLPPATPPTLDVPPTPPAATEPPAQPPTQPATPPEQPPVPAIPPEYLEAHKWRGEIVGEAEAFGGLDMVPQALKWSRMLFGLEKPPEGMTPAGYFMETLFDADRGVYQDILTEIVATHGEKLIPHIEDAVFAKHGIRKDRLEEIRNFQQYGATNPAESARKEFVGLLKPEIAAVFPRLSRAAQDWYIEQTDRGLMTMDFAEEQIRRDGLLLSLQEREEQMKRDEAARVETDRENYARNRANEEIGRFQEVFVDAQARKLGLAKEDIEEKLAFVAGRLDNKASADANHPAAVAWRELQQACLSNNDIRIRAAMGKMRVIVEQEWDAYLASRSGRPPAAPPAQPPAQPRQPQEPQFEPDKAPASTDWSKTTLDDYLFGRATA